MSQKKEKMIIIDGNAIIHRSYHALPTTMKTKNGEITNAVYGFVIFLLKALKEFKPDYVVLTLDEAGPTFRHVEYERYKGHREKADQELYDQIPRIREVVEAFAIPVYAISGFEADDLIGTISRKVDGNVEKIILTGDQDTMQLVNDHTKVYTMSRGVSDSALYDEQGVIEKYGLSPEQMIDYKALRGDPSDNIPGVKGIGEKTATELLVNFKSLDGVYQNIESPRIKDRIKKLLVEHRDQAYMSQMLATIKCDVEMDFDLEKARFGGYNKESIVRLFSDLDFNSLVGRLKDLDSINLSGQSKKDKQISMSADKFARDRSSFSYMLVDTDEKFENFLLEIKKQQAFTFDTETSSLDPLTCQLLGISFSWKEGEAYYLAITNHESRITNDLFSYKSERRKNPWLEKLKPIFSDKEILKHGHNMKYDVRVMRAQGIEVQGISFDTMVASYLLNPGSRQHSLDATVFSEIGFEKISKDDLLGLGKERKEFAEVDVDKLFIYSAEDADFTERLVNKLMVKMESEGLTKLFSELEMPLVAALCTMEDNGIKLDTGRLDKLGQKVKRMMGELEKNIWQLAGEEFNIGSPKQLQVILFDKLGISTQGISKSKTGYSTAADELEKLKDSHKIIALIQDYREVTKLQNTYIDTLPQLINKQTRRLHTCFNQAITATGRLSSTEPNLQNIPIRTELGQEIRGAFVAEAGYKLVSLDYSQIELRLAAHMSDDPKMIKAFNDNLDIHSITAAEINEVALEDVTSEMRREAKAINFGILYGQGSYGLSQGAGISMERAKKFIDKYFETYKEIKKYIEQTIARAKETGHVETLFGRKRYLPDLNSNTPMIRKAAERVAINTPLQGTGADMIKLAMIRCQDYIDKMCNGHEVNKGDVKMLLTVHDELLFEIKEDLVGEISPQLKEIMEKVIELKVPVVVDVSKGDNWHEMEDLA